MGTCYTYLLYDESDWKYSNKTKEETIENIKKELPVAEILASWDNYIVVDLDKNSPWGNNVQRLQKYCDGAYYYPDSAIYEIKKVDFKQLPKDKAIEDNKPANRNAERIEKAYEDWKKHYSKKNSE